MAIPATPSTFNVQTANSQNYLSWGITSGALSYSVQRSLDGVNFSALATVLVTAGPFYLDTAVTNGVQYFYQVAATNGSGTSPYTTAQSAIPVPIGEMCLGQIRLAAQQRADRVNSQFVTLTEWNSYINQSLFELYDLLITQYGEEYFAAPFAQFNTNGTTQLYPVPDGILSFTNSAGSPFVPPAFYKLLGVDLGVNTGPNGWVTLKKFNLIDRNKYFYPNSNSTMYGVFNMSYRLIGNFIEFIPVPSANQSVRLLYIPRMTMLLQDTDISSSGISGWMEYVIVDAAIKALQKEESDVSTLQLQKMALLKRIEATSMNRDAGQADTISDTRSTGFGGNEYGPGWTRGGW